MRFLVGEKINLRENASPNLTELIEVLEKCMKTSLILNAMKKLFHIEWSNWKRWRAEIKLNRLLLEASLLILLYQGQTSPNTFLLFKHKSYVSFYFLKYTYTYYIINEIFIFGDEFLNFSLSKQLRNNC